MAEQDCASRKSRHERAASAIEIPPLPVTIPKKYHLSTRVNDFVGAPLQNSLKCLAFKGSSTRTRLGKINPLAIGILLVSLLAREISQWIWCLG
ncbi:hypothetical protein M2281_001771 [Mesorhizobium soli]|nr:hypothetical protein [Mesorhizobium soli]